jgi:glutathione S-transferase
MKMSQSVAIYHYIAKCYGYMADDAGQTMRQEFALECYNDFAATNCFLPALNPTCSEEECKKFEEKFCAFYTRIEDVFKMTKGKYVAGDKLTVADFVLFSVASLFINNPAAPHSGMVEAAKNTMKKNPCVCAWFERMSKENAPYLAERQMAPA